MSDAQRQQKTKALDLSLAGEPCDPSEIGWKLGDKVTAQHAWGLGARRKSGFVTGARKYPSGQFGVEIGESPDDVGRPHPKFPQFSVGELWNADLCS